MKRYFHTCRVAFSKNNIEPSSQSLKIKSNQMLLDKFSILKSEKRAVKSINQYGFKINDISIKGPAIVLNDELFLWDVPQFGVGGLKDVEPLEKDSWTDPASPFYGWTFKMFRIFEVVDRKPEMLVFGTVREKKFK